MPEILSLLHQKALKEIGDSELASFFIWSGGTALAYYYLQHRQSIDLDFMSTDLMPADYLLAQVQKIAEKLQVVKIQEQKRFNRHEFWLTTKNKKTLRLEFIFYPFPYIKKPLRLKKINIKIDSLEDILTNKTHAIFERNEPKDVFDFYCILQKTKTKFPLILKWVKKKFGVDIDLVILVSKMLQGANRLNQIKPLVLKKEFYNPEKINNFFKDQANSFLKEKIN